MTQSSAKKFNLMMLALLSIFLLPVLIANIIYHYHPQFNFGTTNYGQFVNKLQSLNSLKIRYLNKKNTHTTQKKWALLYFDHHQCNDLCVQRIKKMNSVHQATGKNFYDVEEILLLPYNTTTQRINALTQQFPYLTIATVPLSTQMAIIKNSSKHTSQNQFFILNAKREFVLNYADNAQGNGILRDLQHLLRISNG